LLALGDQPAQRILEIGARIAAQAAIAKKGHLVSAAAQEGVIDASAAEFIDDDRGARAWRRGQKTANQRRLSGAEKAGDNGHRDARAARAFEPPPERAGSAGREDQKSISRM
jgi:hypothetical protein